jgi:hypothetical protein
MSKITVRERQRERDRGREGEGERPERILSRSHFSFRFYHSTYEIKHRDRTEL